MPPPAASAAPRAGFLEVGGFLGGWRSPVAGTRQMATEHGLWGVPGAARGGGAGVLPTPPERTFFLQGFP